MMSQSLNPRKPWLYIRFVCDFFSCFNQFILKPLCTIVEFLHVPKSASKVPQSMSKNAPPLYLTLDTGIATASCKVYINLRVCP